MAYGARLERGLGFIAPQGFKSPILRRRRGPVLSSPGRVSHFRPARPPWLALPAWLALPLCPEIAGSRCPRGPFPQRKPRRPAPLGSIATVTESANPDVDLRVLVYSSDAATRGRVRSALGARPHPDLPRLLYTEVATATVVIEHMDAGGIGLAILDGEAAPTGGLGLAKQLRDELDPCPPILVLTGRPDDRWLADWSRADAAVPHPVDPLRLREAVTVLLRAD